MINDRSATFTRRSFMITTTAFIAGCSIIKPIDPKATRLRFGVMTDAHFADVSTRGSRCYRESLSKIAEFATQMNKDKAEFVIELGDFKDQDDKPSTPKTLKYLQKAESAFQKFNGSTYHVLGNHDVDSLSKKEFCNNVENSGISKKQTYYSFVKNGLLCIVLDANFMKNGKDYDSGNFIWTDCWIHKKQQAWLKKTLEQSSYPAIIFIHQCLDSKTGKEPICVCNSLEIRKLLESSKKVLAVLQGHHHTGNLSRINGIAYYTLKSVVEKPQVENSFAMVEVTNEYAIRIVGYERAIAEPKLCMRYDRGK